MIFIKSEGLLLLSLGSSWMEIYWQDCHAKWDRKRTRRCSHRRCSIKKDVIKNFAILGLTSATLLKRDSNTVVSQ